MIGLVTEFLVIRAQSKCYFFLAGPINLTHIFKYYYYLLKRHAKSSFGEWMVDRR